MNLINNHPFWFIKNYFNPKQDEKIYIQFSKYKYLPDCLSDERFFFDRINVELFNEELFSNLLNSLELDEELAFHSLYLVEKKNNTYSYHIPLIDFQISPNNFNWEIDLDRFRYFFPGMLNKLFLFNSGRSFHGYVMDRLTKNEWIEFNAKLLLLNNRNSNSKSELIDTRWIGHRLLAGYSSLRLSNNTNQYIQMPTYAPFY